LSDLLKHALKEVAVPHTTVLQVELFREVLIADTTVFRFYQLLDCFPATHPDQSSAELHVVQNATKQTIEQFQLTDERTHESSQLRWELAARPAVTVRSGLLQLLSVRAD